MSWQRGVLDVALPLYADGDGRERFQFPGLFGIDSGTTRLHRDGELVGDFGSPGFGSFEVPDPDGTYELSVELHRDPLDGVPWPGPSWWALSTDISASWTFRLADDAKTPPLKSVRYMPPLDINNSAPRNRRFVVPLDVESQPGSSETRVVDLAVEISYDDGKTWQEGSLTGRGDQYKLVVVHRGAGYISLRARLTDDDGNTMSQTILRAYRVR